MYITHDHAMKQHPNNEIMDLLLVILWRNQITEIDKTSNERRVYMN